MLRKVLLSAPKRLLSIRALSPSALKIVDHTDYPDCVYCKHCMRDGPWLKACSKYDTEIPIGQGMTLCSVYETKMVTTEYNMVFDDTTEIGVLYHWEPYGYRPKPFFLLEEGRFIDDYVRKVYEDLLSRLREAGHI